MPAYATAGGWAIVRLSSTPEGLRAGGTWVVDLQVLQHGRTPLAGVHPTVTVTERRTGLSRTVSAAATERAGVYRARVAFPRAGAWAYEIDDGFGQRHSYPVVDIGAAAPAARAPGDDSNVWASLLAAAVVGVAAAGASVAVRRRVTGARPERA
jgi:hypothetical protein